MAHITVGLGWHAKWDAVAGATSYDVRAINEKDAGVFVTNHAVRDVLLSAILAAATDQTSDWSIYVRAVVPTGVTAYSHAVQITIPEDLAPANLAVTET